MEVLKRCAPIVVFLLLVSCSQVLAPEVTMSATVLDFGAAIENITISPSPTYQYQGIQFIVTVRNLGGSPITVSSSSKVEILFDQSVVGTVYLPEESVPAGGAVDLTTSWNAGGSQPGDYQANVTVYFDGYSTSETENFSILAQPVTPPPTPEVPVEEELKATNFSPIIELLAGESKFVSLTVKNLSGSTVTGLAVEASGVAENWVSITPSTINLNPNETRTLNLAISVPAGAQPMDYGLKITISNTIRAESMFILRVRPTLAKPSVMRTIELDREAGTTNIVLNVKNAGDFLEALEITENIPKDLASTVDEISFDPQPNRILEADPVVQWVFTGLHPYETRTITYQVPKILPGYSAYAYLPAAQMAATYEVTELIEILELKTEHMNPGSTGKLSVMLRNNGIEPLTITMSIKLPINWTVRPDKSTIEIASGESSAIVFYVTNPSYTEPATYMGEIRIRHDNQELVRGIAIHVALPTPPPSGVSVETIAPPLVIAGIIGAFAVNRWRNNKEYKNRRRPGVLKLLKHVKEERIEHIGKPPKRETGAWRGISREEMTAPKRLQRIARAGREKRTK